MDSVIGCRRRTEQRVAVGHSRLEKAQTGIRRLRSRAPHMVSGQVDQTLRMVSRLQDPAVPQDGGSFWRRITRDAAIWRTLRPPARRLAALHDSRFFRA